MMIESAAARWLPTDVFRRPGGPKAPGAGHWPVATGQRPGGRRTRWMSAGMAAML